MSPTLCAPTLVQYLSQSRVRDKMNTKTAIFGGPVFAGVAAMRKHAVRRRDLEGDVGAVIEVARRVLSGLAFPVAVAISGIASANS